MLKKRDKVYIILQAYRPGDDEKLIEQVAFLTKVDATKFLKGYINSRDYLKIIDKEGDTTWVQSQLGKKAIWFYKISWIRVF